jgi:hypothetical protein
MTFEIDDGHWRIRFEHDKPRDWGSHIGCRMPIPPDQSPAVAKLMDALKMSAIDPFLWVGCKEEKFYIGQFGEKGFVR